MSSYARLGEDEASVELISAEERRRALAQPEPRRVANDSAPASSAPAASVAPAAASSSSSSSSSAPRVSIASSPAAAVAGSPSTPYYGGYALPVQLAPQPLALAASSPAAATTSGPAINANPEGGRQAAPGFQVYIAPGGAPGYYPPPSGAASSAAAASAVAGNVSTPASMVPLYMPPQNGSANDLYGPPPAYIFAINPFAAASSSSAPSSTVLLEGWLEKKSSGLITSWNKVFAVLTSSHFSYYASEADAHAKINLKNAMPLSLFKSRVAPKEESKKHCLTWTMKTDTRAWQFACWSAETRNQWLEQLNSQVRGV